MKIHIVATLNLSFNGERDKAGAPHLNDTLVTVRLETSVPAVPAVGTYLDAPFFGDDTWQRDERWIFNSDFVKIKQVNLSYAKRGVLEYTVMVDEIVAYQEGDLDAVVEKLENISIPGSMFYAIGGGFLDWKPFAVDSEDFRHLQAKLATWSQIRKS